METEWQIIKFDDPFDNHNYLYLIKHNCVDGTIENAYVWLFNSGGSYTKDHCMKCEKKAPDHFIIQLGLLSGY